MKSIQTAYSSKSVGHYSPGVLVGNMLYVSGQLPINQETKVIPVDFQSQVIQALNNVETVLKAAGLDKNDVAFCRVYLSDLSNWDNLNVIYAQWFGDHKPARVVVPTRELHYGAKIEIEAVAEVAANVG